MKIKRCFFSLLALMLLMVLLVQPALAAQTGINFGVSVDNSAADATVVTVAGSNDDAFAALEQQNKVFDFTLPCDYPQVYGVYDGALIDTALAESQVTFPVKKSGDYTIVNGLPPVVTVEADTITVTVSEQNDTYLTSFTTDCAMEQVTVKRDGVTLSATVRDGRVTIPVDGAGSYVIAKASQQGGASGSSGTGSGTTGTAGYGGSAGNPNVLELTPSAIQKALAQSGSGKTVTVDAAGRNKDTVSLPVSALKKLLREEKDLALVMEEGTLTLDVSALAAIVEGAFGKTVLLHYREIPASWLTAGQKTAVEELTKAPEYTSALTFRVTITSSGKTIRDLKGGSITLRFPFQPEAECAYTVFSLGDAAQAMDTLPEEGAMVTVLKNLGEFFLRREAPETAASEPVQQESIDVSRQTEQTEILSQADPQEISAAKAFPSWILWLLAGLVVCIAAAVFLVKKF